MDRSIVSSLPLGEGSSDTVEAIATDTVGNTSTTSGGMGSGITSPTSAVRVDFGKNEAR
jgi:hypothetical protein